MHELLGKFKAAFISPSVSHSHFCVFTMWWLYPSTWSVPSHGGSKNYSRVISAHNLSFNLKRRSNEVSMTWTWMQQTGCRAFRLIKNDFCIVSAVRRQLPVEVVESVEKNDLNIFTRLCGCFTFRKLIIWKNLWAFWCPRGIVFFLTLECFALGDA